MDQSFEPQSLSSGKDLVVVITGGGTGIGFAFADALYRTGARKLYLLGRRSEPLSKAAQALHSSNNGSSVVVPVQCDVASPSSVAAAAAKIEEEVGYVDVLINNAGITGPDDMPIYDAKTVKDLQGILLNNIEGAADTYAVNSTSVITVSASFLGLLDKGNERRGWESGSVVADRARKRSIGAAAAGIDESDVRTSQIITVTSISGFNRVLTSGLAYHASKAAATHSSKMLATLLAPWGIRSNVIAPGAYPTGMAAGFPNSFPPDKLPAGRMGCSPELAGLILYLVGKGGSYVNGNVEVTDGGRLSVHPSTY